MWELALGALQRGQTMDKSPRCYSRCAAIRPVGLDTALGSCGCRVQTWSGIFVCTANAQMGQLRFHVL